MPLRQDQTKEVLRLFQGGQSVEQIASGMHVAVSDVEPFMPTGELLIAYQRVREASVKRINMAQELSASKSLDDVYKSSVGRCGKAIIELSLSIKETQASLKADKSTLKELKYRLETYETELQISCTESTEKAYLGYCNELDEAALKLELAKKADVLKRQKAADAVARKQRAQRMAENALISAAVEAAKSIVSDSIDKRLIKEEKENG